MVKKSKLNIKNFDRLSQNELSASRHINVLTHYDEKTLLDKNDRLIRIIKLDGLDFVTKSTSALDLYKNRLNTLFKSFTSDFALYFWTIRKKTHDFPAGEFENIFARDLNEKYRDKIYQTEMYRSEIYIAIIAKQAEGFINKGFNFLHRISLEADKKAKEQYFKRRNKELDDLEKRVISTLMEYRPEVLGVYEKSGVKFSRPLEVISMLINFDSVSFPMEIADASIFLPKNRFFFNRKSGTLELRAPDNSKKFAAMLSIKEYAPGTYQSMLDEFSTLKIEYIVTQSYRFFDRNTSKKKLKDQRKDMEQSRDESLIQAEEIQEAFEDAASGDVGFGMHHFTIVCHAETQELLNKNIATITAKFSDLDIIAVREDISCEAAFWAQLPANFGYIARPANLSTKNLASFASLHNFSVGKISGNYWGDAVTVLETLAGSPFYFSYHYKDVGNFIIVGAMGSGKTVLAGFLIAQSMKFGGKRVIFDKDRGLEILVRAMGGVYEIIKPGISTGFNPCQLEDTPENRKFLTALFKKMLTVTGVPLNDYDFEVIENAIHGMYRLEKNERQLCHIASFFGSKKKGSLRSRFDLWHSDGIHAWLFDNADDNLNLSPDVLGFDLGHILDDDDCKNPALMYLTFRVSKALEGNRGLVFFDEGWKAMEDEDCLSFINDMSRTPRKKNNIFGLATQSANDTAGTKVNKSLNESAFCKIFFPNPLADKKVYVDELGLSEYEYDLVKTMPDDKNFFLLNHGRGTNKQSVVLRANLTGLEDVISVISAREQTLQLLDQIRSEVGDDPKIWLPIFHERRKQMEERV